MPERTPPRPHRFERIRATALALVLVLGTAAPIAAESWMDHPVIAGAGAVFDVVIVRPLGLGQLVFGAACFVPAALFAGSAVGDPFETFIRDPYEYTFVRRPGSFEEE